MRHSADLTPTYTVTLDVRQQRTVVAALQLWREHLLLHGGSAREQREAARTFREGLFLDTQPLTADQIVGLCRTLNNED